MGNERKYTEKKEHQEQGLVKQNQNIKKQMKIAPLETQFEVFPFGFNLCSKISYF